MGAGLSGVGAACTLSQTCPDLSYAVVEARDAIGGTWDLFRYPGIRSDSDMHTLGYRFAPWTQAAAIADGPAILSYVRETAARHGVTDHIRFNRKVTALDWSSADQVWRATIEGPDGPETLVSRWVFVCSGYYSYAAGYTPDFPGRDAFKGAFIHPQHWPEDFDYSGKRVVIIGSGATAVTLGPAMAEAAASVTLLQRSPTYVMSRPSQDAIALGLARFLPASWAYGITRWKNVALQMFFYWLARAHPEMVKAHILKLVREELGPDYPVETHFSPSYKPWDQRVCVAPDSDIFEAIRSGGLTMVTDHIAHFTETGVALQSGDTLEADVIVSATGLALEIGGGATVRVDGVEQAPSDTMVYKGVMLSNAPNLALWTGYTNASWTLKCDLTSDYVCRLIRRMDTKGYASVTPRVLEPEMTSRPLIDFSSGYIERALPILPRQGEHAPWRLRQNYFLDMINLRLGRLETPELEFIPAVGRGRGQAGSTATAGVSNAAR